MFNERRSRILSALVEEYIQSARPVASKSLCEHYDLGCSPATVRNELAALEDTGYLMQPHVSAGRVPTDSGYRAFVDRQEVARVALPDLEVEAVHAYYGSLAEEIDGLMRETSTMLSRLTSYVAVVLAPKIARAAIRRVDLVALGPHRVLVVVITDDGQVSDRVIELQYEVLPEELAAFERDAGELLDGKRSDEVCSIRTRLEEGAGDVAARRLVLEGVVECLLEADRERLYHGGASALLAHPEFAEADRFRPLLRLLEDSLSMLETLDEVLNEKEVVVRIGHENRARELGEMSLVAANYGPKSADGVVGVIGPTRMDYARAIAAVRCVSQSLSDVLGG